MTKRAVVFFNIDGAQFVIEQAEAAELADRLHAYAARNIESPAHAGAVLVDRGIEGAAPKEALQWHTPEKDALRAVIEKWIAEVGFSGLPESIVALRYALCGEWQDEAKGDYLLVLEDATGIREVPKMFARPPVPGQALELDGQTYILGNPIPSPGTEWVAVVRATPHPG